MRRGSISFLRTALVGLALTWTGCASSISAPRAITISLHPYAGKLRYLEASSPSGVRLLFDTGGGLTLLSPETARSLNCVPYTRLTALRMNGERFDVDGCGRVSLAFESLVVQPEAAVFDLMTLLPAELPTLHGLASLQTFTDHVVVLDLAHNQLTIADSVAPESLQGFAKIEIRLSRPFAGAGLDALVQVRGSRGPLWFEIDSANLDTVRISNHALDQLGFSPEQVAALRQGHTSEVVLPIEGLGPVRTTARNVDIVYDGVLSADFLEHVKLVLDLRHSQGWARTTQ